MSCLGVTGELRESKQFEWKIADFLSLNSEKGSFYNSSSFVFDNTSLHLRIYPRGDRFAQLGFLSLYFENETDCPLHVTIIMYIKKVDGTLIGNKDANVIIKSTMGFRDFYSRPALELNKSELVPSGILTVICILKHNEHKKQVTTQAEKVKMSTDEASDCQRLTELDLLSDNLKDFATNKDSCDVVLEVEDKEFKAHKAILMARSPVFAAMFQHDTLEKQTGFIKIPDCDSESFQEFLDYLYSGKLENVSFRSAFHLYSTSNKYDIQKLKEFCVKNLIQSLAPDNVCDIFKLADKYDETKLITETQDFFNENWNRIFPTTEWRSFMQNNFRLADKLLTEFSKTKDSQ